MVSFLTALTSDQYRQAATYVDLILEGPKAGDLPIQLPTKYELTVNLKIAKPLAYHPGSFLGDSQRGDRIRRRDFISLVGSMSVVPFSVRAQQPAVPAVELLRIGPPEASANMLAAFRKGLSETGFVEGRNLAIEFRWRSPNDQPSELQSEGVHIYVHT